jgi:hypothetical protein
MKNDFEFKVLIELFECIIDNFINYLKVSDMKVYKAGSMYIAEVMINFDPDIVNAFMDIQNIFKKINESYKSKPPQW